MHGGVAKDDLAQPDAGAVRRGLKNLERHLKSIRLFGVPAAVAINHFSTDAEEEWVAVRDFCRSFGVEVAHCVHWSRGSAGIEDLARKVVELAESGRARFRPLYSDKLPLWDKARCVAQQIYGAEDIGADAAVKSRFALLQQSYGHFPVCMAKTQYSLSTDPAVKGAPMGHTVSIRELGLWAGAEFVVATTDDVMTMPGLPKVAAANNPRFGEKSGVRGFF
jgi:formate--tetrahydrofolate ligase